mgnify:FL=1
MLENLEFNVAARYDRYSDYGSDTSPKVSVRWSPLENLVFRASFGQGFRAPTLDLVTQQPSYSADTVNDPQTCVAFGLPSNCSTQVNAYVIANPNLTSEQSDQYSLGVAWDATDWLNLSLDYYDINIDGRVANTSTATVVACVLGAQNGCPPGLGVLPGNVNPPNPGLGLGVARAPGTGEILYVQRGAVNLGTIDQRGADLNVRTNFDFGDWGNLRNQLQIGYVFDALVDGEETVDQSTSVGQSPKMRANLSTEWTYGDFNFGWVANYIHGVEAFAGGRLPSWTTHDLQATWNAPWNGRFTLGVVNLADKDPVLEPSEPTGRPFDFGLYDQYGRVPYFRYTQTF